MTFWLVTPSLYQHDYEARLVELVLDANTTQPTRITYTYDDRGLRVVKNDGDESTIYITKLGNQVLYELDGAGKARNTYFFANGEKIAQLDPAGKVLYLHNDLLGSPGIITNEAGEVVQRYTYEPFGSLIASEGSVDNQYTFTGKEYDEEAGLYYYGARYYSPLLGRFITFDTVAGELETPISQNRYLYAWANPLKYTDPDGIGSIRSLTSSPWEWISISLPQPRTWLPGWIWLRMLSAWYRVFPARLSKVPSRLSGI